MPDPALSDPQPDEPRPAAPQALKFYFTPRTGTAAELATPNPHAKAATHLPDEATALRERFGEAVGAETEYAGETTVYVDKAQIEAVCRFLKDERGFSYLTDLGGIDRFTEDDRYEVFYSLIAIEQRKRIRVKVRVDEDDLSVPSITGLWPAAMWHEREAWDMFGITFPGHPDLRRMFMPEDFAFHPLRKEFPTLGIPGSLPLPSSNSNDEEMVADPYPRAHGNLPED